MPPFDRLGGRQRRLAPSRVRQEIWGLLIACNLVRLEMERVADEADLPPTRIGFVAVYRPPRRTGRSSPRAVKVEMSSYPKKRRPPARKNSRNLSK